MKIRLLSCGGFESLRDVKFPVEVEVAEFSTNKSTAYVHLDTMASLPGYKIYQDDMLRGGYYYMFLHEEWEHITPPVRDEVQQAKLLSLIQEYGNPFTGVYRRELLWKEIKSIVQEEVV